MNSRTYVVLLTLKCEVKADSPEEANQKAIDGFNIDDWCVIQVVDVDAEVVDVKP